MNEERSYAIDIFRRPSFRMLLGGTAICIAAVGTVATAENDSGSGGKGAIAECTGEQTIRVQPGDTLGGIINSEVVMDHDLNPNLVAKAMAANEIDDDNPLYVYRNNEEVAAPELITGDVIEFPEECHFTN